MTSPIRHHRSALRRGRARRAFTLVEVMIVVALMGIVMGIFADLYIKSLRDARRQFLYMRSHSDAMSAVDTLRPILMPARFNSVTVPDDGSWIEFLDPWNDPPGRSRIERGEWNGKPTLMHTRNLATGTPAEPLFVYPIELVRFGLEESNSVIRVQVTAPADVKPSDQRPYVVDTRFRIRNFQ